MTQDTSGLLNREDIQSQIRGQMPDVIANLRAKAAEHGTPPRREAGYTIQNATGDEAVVRIFDEIWWLGVNALDLTAELDTITAPSIRVEINSPGGDVFDGIAIYNALRIHPAKITTRVDGLAASIASVIAQAGDHRIMVASSQMMIHNAWGMTIGNQTDHEDMAAVLGMQDEILADIYATKSNKDAAYFRGLMNAETWMTAERAVTEGLADEILDPAADKPKDKLIEKITSAAVAAEDAVSGVERLVADHPGAESLTEAKRAGLVALRAAAGRIDGLLNSGTEELHADYAIALEEAAKRDAAFRASLPAYAL
jgi:ATP-dependent protease ClpP protease subunit